MPVDGGLYYFAHQNGEANLTAVVLIHGAGGMHLYWPPQLRRLPGYRVFALDLPGHGKSKDDRGCQSIGEYTRSVLDWFNTLDLHRAVFVGHSMGGAIGLQLALDHPERVLGLGLIGSGAYLPVNSRLLEEVSNPATYPHAVELVVKWSFSPEAPQSLTELAGRRILETRQSVFYGDLLACDAFDVRDRLEEVKRPVLVLCGEQDKMTPVRFSQNLATRIPQSRLEIIPQAGHMVMLEHPEAIARLLTDFLSQIQYQRGEIP